MSSGSSQLASVPYTSALTAASAGQVNFLVNPLHMTAKVTKGLVSAPYPVFVVLGKSSLLQANHVAVTRFVKALRQGAAEMANMSNSELGAMCAKLAAFAGQKATLITKGWEAVHSQLSVGTKAGYISSSTWNHAKQGFSKWDLPGYTATSPLMSYAKVVNMSFWKNAS